MIDRYILVGQTAVPCEDLFEWARWFEKADRHVSNETVGEHRVSTVFLGLDHNWLRLAGGTGEPILYETMIFCLHKPPCDLNCAMNRYETWLDAEAGHRVQVDALKVRLVSGPSL